MKVLFLLPSPGGGGGAHSVAQEAAALQRYGAAVTVANSPDAISVFRVNHPELETHGVRLVAVGDDNSLAELLVGMDIACATKYVSAHQLQRGLSKLEHVRPRAAYYIQDYEPLFCAAGSAAWQAAHSSYTVLHDPILFAKTNWVCGVVLANAGRKVHRIEPSIDHSVYFPGGRVRQSRVVISAMIRPSTPHRAPRRTARIVELLAERYGDKVQLITFGSEKRDLERTGFFLNSKVEVKGHLSRREVAAVLRTSDLFLDLSDYQAFGRTGLEAMACGAVPMLPLFGGAGEYSRHWRNSILIDVRSDIEILDAIEQFLSLSAKARDDMRSEAIVTALGYTVEKTAFSEYELFRRELGKT